MSQAALILRKRQSRIYCLCYVDGDYTVTYLARPLFIPQMAGTMDGVAVAWLYSMYSFPGHPSIHPSFNKTLPLCLAKSNQY